MKKVFWIIWCLFFSACSHPNQEAPQEQDLAIEKSSDKVKVAASSPKVEKVEQQQSNHINCGYDNDTKSLGVGLVIAPSVLEMYDDSLLTMSYMKWDIYSSDTPPAPVCPKYYKPDYGLMHFVCLERTNKYFKVLIGYDQAKYLPAKKEYEYKTWQDYILQSFGIRRSTDGVTIKNNQPVRIAPHEAAEQVQIPAGLELFCPMEVKGDWIKVKYDCFYNMDNNPYEGEPCSNYIKECGAAVTGWIKWRQDNRILVDVFLMP